MNKSGEPGFRENSKHMKKTYYFPVEFLQEFNNLILNSMLSPKIHKSKKNKF